MSQVRASSRSYVGRELLLSNACQMRSPVTINSGTPASSRTRGSCREHHIGAEPTAWHTAQLLFGIRTCRVEIVPRARHVAAEGDEPSVWVVLEIRKQGCGRTSGTSCHQKARNPVLGRFAALNVQRQCLLPRNPLRRARFWMVLCRVGSRKWRSRMKFCSKTLMRGCKGRN